jgi:predicted dehydrogenase/threonine dehydrogenase-like Zn-dependent dehydrogenase
VKQVAQRLRDGAVRVVDAPEPSLDEWSVLVRTQASLLSAGTERTKVETARESLVGKARRRPDLAREVLEKARRDGIGETVAAVRARLDALSPLGYCAAGVAERVGDRVREIRPGMPVACGGEEAAHASLVAVPANLCVPVPDGVTCESAAFTTLGSIALHAFRQSGARLGERVAVVGMGLVGQLAARLARAAGCEVLGVDLDEWRLEVADEAGALDLARLRTSVGDVLGTWDAVLVTAAAPSADPVSLATDLARSRGRIVIVGDVRLELDRRRFYDKELDLRLSRSYGPGRYDREYEQRGLDYPLEYVRWTERRNMGAFLELLRRGAVSVEDLITHRLPIDEAEQAFELLTGDERSLAILILYPEAPQPSSAEPPAGREEARRPWAPGNRAAFIGAGSFAQRVLIPAARRAGLELRSVATSSGLTAADIAERFAFGAAATVDEILGDPDLSAVLVATRHDRHAELALRALRAGKATFVEKPLCVDEAELRSIEAEAARDGAPPLMVGFNRRYAPLTVVLRRFLEAGEGTTNVLVRVNAGPLAPDHWLNDPVEGGGRLVGEGCHFLDLLSHLVGAPPVAVSAQAAPPDGEVLRAAQEFAVAVRFDDGSLATLLYGTAGSRSVHKEFVEAHRGNRSARLDDFSSLDLRVGNRRRTERSRGRDKGHAAELELFARAARGEASPDTEADLASMRLTFAAVRSLLSGHEEPVAT